MFTFEVFSGFAGVLLIFIGCSLRERFEAKKQQPQDEIKIKNQLKI